VETKWKHRCRSVAASLLLCCRFQPFWGNKRKQGGNTVAALLPLSNQLSPTRTPITMTGKPFQSVLVPFEEEIYILRQRRPPYSYARIATILQDKYQLSVCRETIFKFVRARTRSRKVYAIYRSPIPKKPKSAAATTPQTNPKTPKPKPFFEYTPGNRYNLTRLPPEEAAERRKKLEAEGH
jgi:hypothetical protein